MTRSSQRQPATPIGEASHSSIWHVHENELPRFPSLTSDEESEICIIGGGITGLTLAHLLSSTGRKIILIEKSRIGAGTTSHTSAHLDPLTDTRLFQMEKRFGTDVVKDIVKAGTDSIDFIEDTAQKLEIDCGFSRIPAFIYTRDPQKLEILQQEQRVAASLRLAVDWEHKLDFLTGVRHALRFDIHARLNPVLYLAGLAKSLRISKNISVYENSEALHYDKSKEKGLIVQTHQAKVEAKHLVMATHFPFGKVLSIQTRAFPYRSYMLGLRIEGSIPDALFWDLEDPYHYMRRAVDAEGEVLLLGGADHKTGHCENTESSYQALKEYAQTHFKIRSVDYRWSDQFYKSSDGLPYIGHLPFEENVWVATGFDGTGLTWGTAAARLLADKLQKRENALSKVLSPTRTQVSNSIGKMAKENLDVAAHFVGDRVSVSKGNQKLENLERGQGQTMRVKGHPCAVYRDETGELHYHSAVCTHAFCVVHWNAAESTWDCPCHGGRFAASGEVLVGPPTQPLRPLEDKEF